MQGSKLIELYKSFTEEELRWFGDFLRSPYFNKHEAVCQLGEVLIGLRRKGFTAKNMQRQNVFIATWPNQPFCSKTFNNYCSDLLRLGHRFLVQRSFEAEEAKTEYHHLLTCDARQLQKSWPRQHRRSQKLVQDQRHQDPDMLWRQYQLHALEQDRFSRSGQRTTNPHLQAATDALDRFYYAKKMKLSCTMLNAQLALGSPMEFHLLAEENLAALPQLPGANLAQLYAQAYQLLRTSNWPDLLDAYTLAMQQQASVLAQPELNELINHAVNYCVRQIRDGHRIFVDKLLAIYQENLRAGHLFVDGVLSPWNYKNMVKLGLGLRRFEWVKELVENYANRLPAADQSDAYHFTMADICYHQQDFDGALDYLNQTEFSDIHYALGAKVMLIKIYHETDAVDPLLSLLFSFKVYLRRNRKIGPATRDAYLNFIRFVEQLQAGRDLKKIRARIQKTKALTDRNWLLSQQ